MDTKYTNKILYYEESNEFLLNLPRRVDFIDKDEHKKLLNNIKNGTDIFFLINDICEMHIKENNRLVYKLCLIGILIDGSKACVILNNIKLFFDIRIPETINALEFQTYIEIVFKNNNLYYDSFEIIKKFPFKYFQENSSNYLRVYFNTLHARNNSLKFILNNDFEHEKIGRTRLETASNDLSCYYRKVAREYKIKLCSWNIITDYEINTTICKKNIIGFKINCKNIMNIEKRNIDISDPKYSYLLKDKTMVSGWDLETFTNRTGDVPLPNNVFDINNEPQDVIKMNSNTYFWYYEKNPFLKICITDIITQPRDDCLIIICKDQVEIIKTQALLMERMMPEFFVGFNDGMYDWPFILRRAEQYDRKKDTNLYYFMKKHMTVLNPTPDILKYNIIGKKIEKIKIEADLYTDAEFFCCPGFICIDVRNIFRQLYPTSEKSSLNFYLSLNKLESKEDMSYKLMATIFRISNQLIKEFRNDNNESEITYDNLIQYVQNSQKTIENYKTHEIIELLNKTTLIVHYCNIDAQRCQDLLRIRSIISDRREMANLSYTSMYDALYRAGGMKVRNLVIAEGIQEKWNLVFSNISTGFKDKRKYPGAYVVPPKKGLYRDHKSIKATRKSETDQINNDNNDLNDRPCGGMDFSSLYPNIIITYNLSAEKVVVDEQFKKYLENKMDKFNLPYRFIEVDFLYGLPDQNPEEKEHVHGWVIQHHPVPNNEYQGMGLFPTILKWLFDRRALLKKRMEYFQILKEFIEKVFEIKKLSDLVILPLEKQIEFVNICLEKELDKRQKDYEKFQKNYYKSKVENIKEIIKGIKKEWTEQLLINSFYEELCFQFNYLNVKQNALKVFMNTFYGTCGDTRSPLFLPHVAGGTTIYGQKNIKMIKKFTEMKKFDVKYGDTDSLYISAPEEYFKEIDIKYENGIIDKPTYWSEMIEISMQVFDKFKEEIAEVLYKDNGTKFLKMAYEEILFPYAFVGKKKYIGIQHQGIVNLSACMPNCTLDEFSKSKSLFIRGLELKKRGSSQFLKIICYEILKDAFSIESTKTLKEIVEEKLKTISQRNWDSKLFIKTAKYKITEFNSETGEEKPGNVSVKCFAKRMLEIEQKYPSLGIKCPELGERFNYVITKKYPFIYDIRGRKKNIKIGEKYEYEESLYNQEYHKILGEPLEVDIDHYVLNELIGQFSRFIIYHPDYDKFFTEDMYEDDDKYKKADKDAHNFAKKTLQKYFRENFAFKYEIRSNYYKELFKNTNAIVEEKINNLYGPRSIMLHITNSLISSTELKKSNRNISNRELSENDNYNFPETSDDPEFGTEIYQFNNLHMKQKLKEKITENAQKEAKKMTDISYFTVKRINPFKLYALYISSDNSIFQIRRRLLIKKLNENDKLLYQLLPEFQKICINYNQLLEHLINKSRSDNELDINNIDIYNEDHYEILDKLYNVYLTYISIYILVNEMDLIKDEIESRTARKVGNTTTISKKSILEEFKEWIQKNKTLDI